MVAAIRQQPGCRRLDVDYNRLICGVEHPPGSFQFGVFALDTNDGSLAWTALYDAGVHAAVAPIWRNGFEIR
jgi:hypothetical protein